MRSVCDRLVIVVSHADVADLLGRFHPDEVLVEPLVEASYLAGVRAGLLSMTKMTGGAGPSSPIIVSGSHVLAPVGPVAPLLDHLADSGAGLFAPYWHNIDVDQRISNEGLPSRVPYLDFALLSAELLASDGFRDFWHNARCEDDWTDFRAVLGPFTRFLERNGHGITYPFGPTELQTSDPRLYEVHRLVAHGCPCLPLAVFSLDPLLHDLNAIALRSALDLLRDRYPAAYATAIRHVTSTIPMRSFNAECGSVRDISA